MLTVSVPCGVRIEHFIQLLGDSDEGGATTQFLQLGGTHICAGWSNTPQNVLNSPLNVTSVFNLYRLPFRGPGNTILSGSLRQGANARQPNVQNMQIQFVVLPFDPQVTLKMSHGYQNLYEQIKVKKSYHHEKLKDLPLCARKYPVNTTFSADSRNALNISFDYVPQSPYSLWRSH